MDEIVAEFVTESLEGLDELDREFVALEQHPDDHDAIASVFRTIHTVKGTAGFLGFDRLQALAHVGESLMSRVRDGELLLDRAITDGLLSLVDALRAIVSAIEAAGTEPPGNDEMLLTLLEDLHSGTGSDAATKDLTDDVAQGSVDDPVATPSTISTDAPGPPIGPHAREESGGSAGPNSVRVDVALLDRLMNLVGEQGLSRSPGERGVLA